MSNAALFYVRDGFETARSDLMGRHAAGEGMLRAMARRQDVDRHYACVPDRASFDAFVGKMTSFGLPRGTPCEMIALGDAAGLRKAGCLFLPQPKIHPFAWQRRAGSQRDYSLCGVTHTISSHAAMDAVGDLLTAPVQAWDAVICTSPSVRASFERILSEHGAYLRARFGARHEPPRPMLPVIPLGIHCDQFDPPDKARHRSHWREALGAAEDDLVILFVGRLSFHAKAHPFPMYRALEMASRRAPGRTHLVQAGWFGHPGIETAFREGARQIAPGVTHHFLDGRGAEVRFGIWHAADIFCSLSDNIQETFGLTPLEAMAAGLPVVASDWDGYRTTIRHGVQGFLVPTYAPAPGYLDELARAHAAGSLNYDHFLLNTCSAVAVDVDAAAAALGRLLGDRDLRLRMGEAGRRHAREVYDWSVIIRHYAELWDEMAEMRRTAVESCPRCPGRPSDPLRDDPFALFEGYATHRVAGDSRIAPIGGDLRADIARLRALEMNRLSRFLGDEALASLCEQLRGPGARRLSEVLAGFPADQHGLVTQSVLWLKKMGLVEIEPGPGGAGSDQS